MADERDAADCGRTVDLWNSPSADGAPVAIPPNPFDETPPHDVYDRYEFPDPTRVRRYAENQP
jgi:hypothetical protein